MLYLRPQVRTATFNLWSSFSKLYNFRLLKLRELRFCSSCFSLKPSSEAEGLLYQRPFDVYNYRLTYYKYQRFLKKSLNFLYYLFDYFKYILSKAALMAFFLCLRKIWKHFIEYLKTVLLHQYYQKFALLNWWRL